MSRALGDRYLDGEAHKEEAKEGRLIFQFDHVQ